MKQKLSTGKLISLSLMLFAMFFGAGNMIFPPMIGQQAGENFLSGVLGFVATDAGLSLLGLAAIVLAGTQLEDLGGKVSKKFAVFMSIVIYLLIGPCFALPRTATVSFELAVVPFLPTGVPRVVFSLVFSAIFFGITYFLCFNPSKLVDIVGKVLTPILLVAIAVIFIVNLINPVGQVGTAAGDYADIPFFRGMIEGYLALDGLAALAFAVVVINGIKEYGVTERSSIVRYTLIAGAIAVIGLGAIYVALGYVGATTSSLPSFANGGQLLAAVVGQLLGNGGIMLLGLAVLMACLTTSIGLASAFSNYFHSIIPRFSYKGILGVVCFFSFAISNVGLTTMIQFTLPALVMIYPPAITLVVLSFFDRWIKGKSEVYALSMLFAFAASVFDGLKTAGVSLGTISEVAAKLPLFDLGFGWVIPALIGAVIGLLSFVNFLTKRNMI